MERVDTYLLKAFEAKQQDLRDEALHYFLKASSEEPEDIEILIELAKSQVDCGLKNKARLTLHSALHVDCDDMDILLELSRTLRLAGETTLALELFHQIGLDPAHSAQAPQTTM